MQHSHFLTSPHIPQLVSLHLHSADAASLLTSPRQAKKPEDFHSSPHCHPPSASVPVCYPQAPLWLSRRLVPAPISSAYLNTSLHKHPFLFCITFNRSPHWITLIYKPAVIFLKKKVFFLILFLLQTMAPFLSSLLQQSSFSVVCSARQFIKDLGVMNAMANSEVFSYQDHLKQPITPLHIAFSSLAPGTQTPTRDFLPSLTGVNPFGFLMLQALLSLFPSPSPSG